jgi:hypothetical protein
MNSTTIVLTFVKDGLLNRQIVDVVIPHNSGEATISIEDIHTYLNLEKLRWNSLKMLTIEGDGDNCLRIYENGTDLNVIITYIRS